MDKREFVRLWLEWDDKPSDEGRARHLEAAVVAEAQRRCVSSAVLREEMAALRRAGATAAEAYDLLSEPF
jgi:uncharacterized protein with PIN domain